MSKDTTAPDPTAKPPEFGRQIATTQDGRDITRGYTGPLLLPTDTVLRTRGNWDWEIYETVLSDDEVKSALNQRQLAVTRCEWQVDAGGKRAIDQAAADFLREQLDAIGWDNITTKMLFGVFYGFAVAEVIYAPQGRYVGIDRIVVRNRRRFRFGEQGDLRLLTPQALHEGEPAEPPYFWSFSCGADNDDEPYGLGLAHWLYWPVLFKRNGVKFWLIFLEKFGMPTAVGEYDGNNTSDEEQAKLLRATKAIQTDSGIIIPTGMKLQLLEAARSGTADYETLYARMNEAIQKVVLGQTASTQGTPGKLGGQDLQGDVRRDIVTADADLVCESFNLGPVKWLTAWNFPGAVPPRVYRVTDEPADLNAMAERDVKIATGLGYRRTPESVNELYGEGWEPATPTTPPWQAGNPAAPAQFSEGAPAVRDEIDDMVDDALADWQPLLDPMVAPVQAMLDEAARQGLTAAEVLKRLPNLLSEMDDSALTQSLTRSVFAAGAGAEAGLDDTQQAGA